MQFELQALSFFRIGWLLQLPFAMADAVQSSMWSRLYWARSAANWASIAATAAYNRGVEMEEDGDTPQWTVIAGALGSARPAATIGEPRGRRIVPRGLGQARRRLSWVLAPVSISFISNFEYQFTKGYVFSCVFISFTKSFNVFICVFNLIYKRIYSKFELNPIEPPWGISADSRLRQCS